LQRAGLHIFHFVGIPGSFELPLLRSLLLSSEASFSPLSLTGVKKRAVAKAKGAISQTMHIVLLKRSTGSVALSFAGEHAGMTKHFPTEVARHRYKHHHC
jgi:hypothetical protein